MSGRPKNFDTNQLLTKSVECFWKLGYQGTSVRDVAAAAGVTTGTLYNEYGGKDDLYTATLLHYIQTIIQPRVETILLADKVDFLAKGVTDSPIERIRYFVASSVIGLPKSVAHQACLLVNSQIELSDPQKKSIQKAINQGLKIIEKGLTHQLTIGQQQGTVSLDAADALIQIDIFMTGLLLTAKTKKHAKHLQNAIDQFIDHLFQA